MRKMFRRRNFSKLTDVGYSEGTIVSFDTLISNFPSWWFWDTTVNNISNISVPELLTIVLGCLGYRAVRRGTPRKKPPFSLRVGVYQLPVRQDFPECCVTSPSLIYQRLHMPKPFLRWQRVKTLAHETGCIEQHKILSSLGRAVLRVLNWPRGIDTALGTTVSF